MLIYSLIFIAGVTVGFLIQQIINSRKNEIFICDYWGEVDLVKNGTKIGRKPLLFKVFYDLTTKEYSVKSPIKNKDGEDIGGFDLPENRIRTMKNCMKSDGLEWKSYLDEIKDAKLGGKK